MSDVPRISPWLLAWFRWSARRQVARHFHAVRLAGERPGIPAAEPLVVFLNHASWWDPLVAFVLAEICLPDRACYAPMDEAALTQYKVVERLGLWGIDRSTLRGAARFWRVADAILRQPRTALWITPEGNFTDPRRRPVSFQPGLAHIARRMQRGLLLPLAIEYPFWEERYPEVLVRFGKPIDVAQHRGLSVGEWQERLEDCLEDTQNRLAELAIGRERFEFGELLAGAVGIGGVYETWRRFKAWLRAKARWAPRRTPATAFRGGYIDRRRESLPHDGEP